MRKWPSTVTFATNYTFTSCLLVLLFFFNAFFIHTFFPIFFLTLSIISITIIIIISIIKTTDKYGHVFFLKLVSITHGCAGVYGDSITVLLNIEKYYCKWGVVIPNRWLLGENEQKCLYLWSHAFTQVRGSCRERTPSRTRWLIYRPVGTDLCAVVRIQFNVVVGHRRQLSVVSALPCFQLPKLCPIKCVPLSTIVAYTTVFR